MSESVARLVSVVEGGAGNAAGAAVVVSCLID